MLVRFSRRGTSREVTLCIFGCTKVSEIPTLLSSVLKVGQQVPLKCLSPSTKLHDGVFRNTCKGKGLPQQAEMAQGVPGRLRPRIFLTFGTTRVVDRQPYAPAAFTPGEIPGTHF